MPLRIDDGYTLRGRTSGVGNSDSDKLPVVEFEYRPPTAAEMAQYRMDMRDAKTGADEHRLRCAFVAARLVSWDVETADGKRSNVTPDLVAKLPDPILLDLSVEVTKWKPKVQEDAAGNS